MTIHKINYPFKTLIQEIPETIQKNLATKIAKKNIRSAVAFFTPKENSTQELLMRGSGFLMDFEDLGICIVTASHVITQIMHDDFRMIIVNGGQYLLRNVNVFHQEDQDYAVIEPPEGLREDQRKFSYFTSVYRPELTPLKSFMIIGFPAKGNSIHKGKKWEGLENFNLVFHNFAYDTETEDIYFEFDLRPGKKGSPRTFEPDSKSSSLPSLAGMSGSAIVQIMFNYATDTISLRPIGIFKEVKQAKDKYLIGCTFKHFGDEINNLITIQQGNQS